MVFKMQLGETYFSSIIFYFPLIPVFYKKEKNKRKQKSCSLAACHHPSRKPPLLIQILFPPCPWSVVPSPAVLWLFIVGQCGCSEWDPGVLQRNVVQCIDAMSGVCTGASKLSCCLVFLSRGGLWLSLGTCQDQVSAL